MSKMSACVMNPADQMMDKISATGFSVWACDPKLSRQLRFEGPPCVNLIRDPSISSVFCRVSPKGSFSFSQLAVCMCVLARTMFYVNVLVVP